MYTNLDSALDGYNAMESDYLADAGEDCEVDPRDIVVSLSYDCDDATLRALCQVQLGYVPAELESRLGKTDWLEGVL